MPKNITTQRLYYIAAFAVVVLGFSLAGLNAYSSYSSQRAFLGQRVAGLASALPKDAIDNLTAQETDIDTRDYRSIKSTLQDIAKSNSDIRFIYITKQRNSEVFFVADSEPEGSEDESPPGQLYEEVDEGYRAAHDEVRQSVIGPTTDRWGTWISGVATITDDEQPIAVLGMDIPAQDYMTDIVYSGVVVVLPTLLIATVLIFAASKVGRKDKELVERLTLLALVTSSVKTPLEGVKWAAQQLVQRQVTSTDPESVRLASELSASVDKVVQSVDDIVNVTKNSRDHKDTTMVDRVDIVALVIDTIDRFKLNTSTKRISVLLGDSWPASFVIDTRLVDINRLVTALVARSVDLTENNGSVRILFAHTQKNWNITSITGGGRIVVDLDNDESLAILKLLAGRLGGTLDTSTTDIGDDVITIMFPLKGTEIQR